MGSTNLPEGIVHIYRDSGMRNTGKATTSAEASTSPRNDSILAHMDAKNEIISVDEDGIMLGVLAVPSWMTPSDFLAYVAPAAQGMSHIRMIRYANRAYYELLARRFIIPLMTEIPRPIGQLC